MIGTLQKPVFGRLPKASNPYGIPFPIGLYLFNETFGNPFDLIKGESISLTNISWVPDGIEANAGGEYGTLDNTNRQYISESQGTIIMGFKSNAAFADAVIHILFGAIGAATDLGDFFIAKWDDNLLYCYLFPVGAGRYERWGSSSLPNWQTGQQLAFQWDVNGAIWNADQIVLLVDGQYQIPASGNSDSGWAVGTMDTSLGILNDVEDTSRDADGVLSYLQIYNEVLSQPQVAQLSKDPFPWFKRDPIDLWVATTSVGAPAGNAPTGVLSGALVGSLGGPI